jgi:adenylyl-sulfate kinase
MIIDREPAEQLPARMPGAAGAAKRTAAGAGRRARPLVTAKDRIIRYGQRPATVWLTGLAGCGKSEIVYALEKKLFASGAKCVVLEGESVRHGLSRELDFSAEGLTEHLRRVAETARMMNDAGLIALCAFVSPSASVRAQAAEIVGKGRFLEVHIDAPVAWCEARDTTGLYRKARQGKVRNLAGVDIPYETPARPALRIEAAEIGIDAAVEAIVKKLRAAGIFPAKR